MAPSETQKRPLVRPQTMAPTTRPHWLRKAELAYWSGISNSLAAEV